MFQNPKRPQCRTSVRAQNASKSCSRRRRKTCTNPWFPCFSLSLAHISAAKNFSILTSFRRKHMAKRPIGWLDESSGCLKSYGSRRSQISLFISLSARHWSRRMVRRSLWWSQGARSSSWPREQTCDRAEERATALDDHRYHVAHAPGIVVTYAAALHRRLLLAGERFLTLIDLALHVCKGMHFLSSLQASGRKR